MEITKRTHVLFISLLVVIVFSGALGGKFVWDDKFLIVHNPYIKSWDYISKIFTSQLYEGSQMSSNFYRPLQLMSFTLDYSIWRLNPYGYHLTNVILHALNSILVYLVILALSSTPFLALVSALFFSVSSAISGITYYASARSDLLMAFFMFLSFLFFIRYEKKGKLLNYLFSLLAFFLALISKEMAIVLLIIILLEIVRSKRPFGYKWRAISPFLIVLGNYTILRFSLSISNTGNALLNAGYPGSIPLWNRLLTDIVIVPKYLGLLFFPYGLHMEWFIKPVKTIFQIEVIFCALLLALGAFIIKRLYRINKLALFGAAWFLLCLLPVLNIYPISVLFGEGWLYIPSVGFFIVMGVIFNDLIRPKIGKLWTGVSVGALLVYYGLFTYSYGIVWYDSVNLFHNVIKYEAKSPFIHLTYNNLGLAYYAEGDLDNAVKYCKKSIEMKPGFAEPYNNLAVTYAAMERPIKAIKYFKKAITLKRSYVSSYYNLAHIYKTLGFSDKAIMLSKKAIELDPNAYKAYNTLGYIYSDMGQDQRAIEFFKKSIKIRSEDYEAHYCLGSIYKKIGKVEDALKEYNMALRLGLGDYNFYNEIVSLYVNQGNFKEAERFLHLSLAANNNQAGPHNNLGNIYSILGNFEAAIDEYRQALRVEPGNVQMRENLEKTKREWKNSRRTRYRIWEGRTYQ